MIPAHLRIGSLEILAALAGFGILAARTRFEPATQPRTPSPVVVDSVINEAPARGGRREQQLTLQPGERAIIGRSSQADVGVLDPEASRSHAVFSLVDGVLYLSDAGSRNGTFLDGKAVAPGGVEVFAGDSVDVGTTRITVNGIRQT